MNDPLPAPATHRVSPPYYEVTVRLPLDLYDEAWFYRVADAAGHDAAVSGSITPGAERQVCGAYRYSPVGLAAPGVRWLDDRCQETPERDASMCAAHERALGPRDEATGLLWEVARANRVAGNDDALALLVTGGLMERIETLIGFDEMGG